MARRGKRKGSNRNPARNSVKTPYSQTEESLLRHPSQILTESRTRSTKSSGPSTTTYRRNVLQKNNIYIKVFRDEPQDIKLLVKSLMNMEKTIVAVENDFIDEPDDPRITPDEAMLTVSKSIPSRVREIKNMLPRLSFEIEKSWEWDIGTPLFSLFRANYKFRAHGGGKWSMIYDAPPYEALPLSTPAPDFVFSISSLPDNQGQCEVGIEYTLLEKLQEKCIPYRTLSYAENQAGSSVAIALTLLRRLRERAHSDKQLPVFVLTSQGPLWQIYISHEQTIHDVRNIKVCRFLLVSIDDPEDAHRLMVVLDRICEWAVNTYIPTIKEMIHSVISEA